MAQALLILPAELPQYGMTGDFLDQFRLRPLLVQIVAGGALGMMTWHWKQAADAAYSEVIATEAGTSFAYAPSDPSYAVLTFAAGTYNANDVYAVTSAGVVTGGTTTGVGLLTATRFDAVSVACGSATSRGCTWMKPRVVGPVISVGQQIKRWLADMVAYDLRSRQGMTPPSAGASADENVRMRAIDAEKNLKAIGISEERPDDLVDSSPGNEGAGFTAQPISGDPVGWDNS